MACVIHHHLWLLWRTQTFDKSDKQRVVIGWYIEFNYVGGFHAKKLVNILECDLGSLSRATAGRWCSTAVVRTTSQFYFRLWVSLCSHLLVALDYNLFIIYFGVSVVQVSPPPPASNQFLSVSLSTYVFIWSACLKRALSFWWWLMPCN